MNNYGLNLGISSFLFWRSQMSPHVMYGSAGILALFYLGLSRGIVSQIYFICYLHCDTQCSSLGSLVFAHLGSIKIIMQLIDTNIPLSYNYNILPLLQYHKYTNAHLTVKTSLNVSPLLFLFSPVLFWCAFYPVFSYSILS